MRNEKPLPRQTPPHRGWRIKGLSEIDVPPYLPDAIEQIATILSVTGGDALDGLRIEIEDIAARYLGLENTFDQAPKAAETRAALAEILDAADTLLKRLEGLDDESRIALDLAASGSKVTPTEAKFGLGKKVFEQGAEEVEAAIQHIYNLQATTSAALDLLPQSKRGRPPVIAFYALVWMLAHVYERETGQAPKGGPFHNLVHACAKPLMPIQSKAAFEKHVRRALKARP